MVRTISIAAGGIHLSGLEKTACGNATARGAILALHGGGYSAGYWNYPDDTGESLLDLGASQGYHMLALDRPGYGQSFGSDTALLTLDAQVDLLFEAIGNWLKALRFEGPVFVLGHSLGGHIALLMAADPRGADLTAIATCGVTLRFSDNESGNEVTSWDNSGDYFAVLTPEWQRKMMFGPEGTFSEAALAYDLTTLRPMSWTEYAEAIDQPRTWPSIWPSIEVPVHFALGEFEAMAETGEDVLGEVAGMLCGSELSTTLLQPRSGHNISLHHVARDYHLSVLSFFARCGSQDD